MAIRWTRWEPGHYVARTIRGEYAIRRVVRDGGEAWHVYTGAGVSIGLREHERPIGVAGRLDAAKELALQARAAP